jgi:hypothetical protein
MIRVELFSASALRRWLVGSLGIAALTAAAATGPMDFLFTTGAPPAADNTAAGPRVWKLGEFSAVRLQAREAGAPANQHPAVLNPERLRVELAALELAPRSGDKVPLFSADEIGTLVPALVRAFAAAAPADDVLLLSTARREGGYLSIPMSLAARLFMQDGALQLIVSEARSDLYGSYRASRIVPAVDFGSRARDAATNLRSVSANARRANWLALPVLGVAAASTAAPPAPAATAATPATAAAVVAPAAVAPAAVAKPAEAAAPARTRDAAFFAEQEQRLRSLKRLREQDLISEDEYQQKRREIVQSM